MRKNIFCGLLIMFALALGAGYLVPSFGLAQESQEHWQSRPVVLPETDVQELIHPSVMRVNAKTHEILEGRVKLDYFEMRLEDVAEDLTTRFKVRVILDESAVENGLNEETLITRGLDGLPLRTALEIMLGDFNCTYQIAGDVVLFIDKEAAFDYSEIRMFDCRDLLKSDGQGKQSAEKLIRLIMSSVEPYSWDANGGKGSISEFGGVLVVRHRSTHQVSVQKLLEQLGKHLAAVDK